MAECQDLASVMKPEASHANELDYASMNDYVVVGGLMRSVTQFSSLSLTLRRQLETTLGMMTE
jgi:hypothetical protein